MINENFLGMLGGLTKQFQAANITSSGANREASAILQGGEMSAQGYLLSAAGYRTAQGSIEGSLNFNLAIDRKNLTRQLSATSRQAQRVLGRQTVEAASSGFNLNSKSFLMLRNEATDLFSNALLNLKLDAENTRRSNIFQAEVQKVNLENQARAAEFQAAVARTSAINRANQASFQGTLAQKGAWDSAFKAAPTLLSSLFD